jgi:hypothetical protein
MDFLARREPTVFVLLTRGRGWYEPLAPEEYAREVERWPKAALYANTAFVVEHARAVEERLAALAVRERIDVPSAVALRLGGTAQYYLVVGVARVR